jgi:hypothetical protein
VKAGIKRTWTPLGATVLWGEGGQYEDQFSSLAVLTFVAINFGGRLIPGVPAAITPFGGGGVCFNNRNVFITDSTVNRWGAGVVQEIDAAAMHVWFNWQHLELDANFVATASRTLSSNFRHVSQSFDDLDMFMAGGVIFF